MSGGAHTLIVGMTEAGKTTVAKQMILKARARSVKSIVLDILADPAYNADFSTSNEDEFLKAVWNSRQCAVFVDEGIETVGQYNKSMFTLATRGRHWGHKCTFLTQRPTGINPTIRDNCSNLFLFRAGVQAGKLLAEDFAQDELKNCSSLILGEYYFVNRNGLFVKGDIFEETYGINRNKPKVKK